MVRNVALVYVRRSVVKIASDEVSPERQRVRGIAECERRNWIAELYEDSEGHRSIELLPDRTAETLATYVREHSPIAFVSRDRSTEYMRGIRLGAPQAVQIAERWHLLKNLQEVLERILASLRVSLRALPPVALNPVAPLWPRQSVRSTSERALRQGQRERRVVRFEQVCTLHAQGFGILRIAKILQISRVTMHTSRGHDKTSLTMAWNAKRQE